MRFSLCDGVDGMKREGRADERSVLYNSLLRQGLTIGGLEPHQAYAGSDVGLVSISRLDGVVR